MEKHLYKELDLQKNASSLQVFARRAASRFCSLFLRSADHVLIKKSIRKQLLALHFLQHSML